MKDIKNVFAWLEMRQAWAIWLKLDVREASVTLNKAGKAHDNTITTQHKVFLREISQQKITRSMRLLRNVMATLYNGFPHPKGQNVSMGTKCK